MQILRRFTDYAQQYAAEISTPDHGRPDHCPQCQAQQPLIAHGFYSRTLVVAGFDGSKTLDGCPGAAICADPAGAPYRCYRSSLCPTCVSASP